MTNVLLIALSALETGHRPAAIGPRGEVSRYQVMPHVWRAHGGGNPRNDAEATRVASAVMLARYRGTDPVQWYLAWHCPGRKPTAADLRLAQRFANLVSAYTDR